MFEERVISGAHDIRRKYPHFLRGRLVVVEALKDVLINCSEEMGSGTLFCAVTLSAVDERIAMEQIALWTDSWVGSMGAYIIGTRPPHCRSIVADVER